MSGRLRLLSGPLLAAALLVACGPAVPAETPSPSPAVTASPAQAASPSPLPSATATASASPSPVADSIVLPIAMDFQDHRLSCEAAALKMALQGEGISAGEDQILAAMGNDRRPASFDASGGLAQWGDPGLVYVGDPDGRIELYQGYGVYDAPLAAAATALGGRVIAHGSNLPGDDTGISPAALYELLLAGHPAVAWISNTYHDVALSRYRSFEGATVWYTLTEHAVTVIGVRPDAVLVNDPWYGQAWHPKAEFESAYKTFEWMAVVLA